MVLSARVFLERHGSATPSRLMGPLSGDLQVHLAPQTSSRRRGHSQTGVATPESSALPRWTHGL
jgi:hypothetical protein